MYTLLCMDMELLPKGLLNSVSRWKYISFTLWDYRVFVFHPFFFVNKAEDVELLVLSVHLRPQLFVFRVMKYTCIDLITVRKFRITTFNAVLESNCNVCSSFESVITVCASSAFEYWAVIRTYDFSFKHGSYMKDENSIMNTSPDFESVIGWHVTCSSFAASFFLIHALPWPWGSIRSGYRVARVTIKPFCTDNSSVGKPCTLHSLRVALSTSMVI